jgi:hypothetical protein
VHIAARPSTKWTSAAGIPPRPFRREDSDGTVWNQRLARLNRLPPLSPLTIFRQVEYLEIALAKNHRKNSINISLSIGWETMRSHRGPLKTLLVATAVSAAVVGCVFAVAAAASERLPHQYSDGDGNNSATVNTPQTGLLSWDDCRTTLDTYDGRELDKRKRVLDYCLGMARGRESMREELLRFPDRASLSTSPTLNAPKFFATGSSIGPLQNLRDTMH